MEDVDEDLKRTKDGKAVWARIRKPSSSPIVSCKYCGKRIRYQGMNGHVLFNHPGKPLPKKQELLNLDPFAAAQDLADKLLSLFNGDKKKVIKVIKEQELD